MTEVVRPKIDFSHVGRDDHLRTVANRFPIERMSIAGDAAAKERVARLIRQSNSQADLTSQRTPDSCFVIGANYTTVDTPKGQTIFTTTAYDDQDPYGILGGSARTLAGLFVHQSLGIPLTPAASEAPGEIMRKEFEVLGVPPSMITFEPSPPHTFGNLQTALQMAKDQQAAWILFLSNTYHLPRLQGMWDRIQRNSPSFHANVSWCAAEDVLSAVEPGFAEYFTKEIMTLPSYLRRVANEERGVTDLNNERYAAGERKPVTNGSA